MSPFFYAEERGVLYLLNNYWDKEYNTQWLEEKDFLASKGIRYTFVKEVGGVTTWKYEKNKELFQCLFEFYSMKFK